MSKGPCATCVHWGAERKSHGTCRVDAPSAVGNDFLYLPIKRDAQGREALAVYKGVWPWTAAQDWCGRYIMDPTK